MGRKKKYSSGIEILSLSLEREVFNALNRISNEQNLPRSEVASNILKLSVLNDIEYCKMMARRLNSDFQFWKLRIDEMERNPDIYNIKV